MGIGFSRFWTYCILDRGQKLAWNEYIFCIFSCFCISQAVLDNLGNFGNSRGKALIILCPAIIGAGHFLSGVARQVQHDEGTSNLSGCFIAIIGPPILYILASLYANPPDEKLNDALTEMFKSLPSVMGIMLNISSAPSRCIMAADVHRGFESIS